jgi:hypothetical protein
MQAVEVYCYRGKRLAPVRARIARRLIREGKAVLIKTDVSIQMLATDQEKSLDLAYDTCPNTGHWHTQQPSFGPPPTSEVNGETVERPRLYALQVFC